MQRTDRIVFNSFILYGKIVVSMAISLITVPIVLHALGEDDFGLFNLVAGIVAMLAFLNGTMTVSTQRYLSVTIGQADPSRLLQVYNLSIVLHAIIGLFVVILIESALPLLFQHALNIQPEQHDAALLLFHTLAASMFLSIITVPFDAVLNAYENMVFFSLMGIVESVLKLCLAFSLTFFASGKLEYYAFSLTAISLILLVVKFVYCQRKYKKLSICLKSCRNVALLKEMFLFAGWNTLTSLSVVGRLQGIAIIFNHFFGTIINAAYGIANQVGGVLGYFSATIQKSINPQLMESEGRHDPARLQMLTFALTKYSSLILMAIALPLLLEMPYIMRLWIGDVPAYTVDFSRLVILLSIITQLSAGLMSAIQSSGRIKWYAIVISSITLATIPLAYLALHYGLSPVVVLFTACAVELIAFAARLWFARHIQSIPVWSYISQTIIPNLLLAACATLCLYGIQQLLSPSLFRLVTLCLADIVLMSVGSFYCIFNTEEKTYITNKIQLLLKTR